MKAVREFGQKIGANVGQVIVGKDQEIGLCLMALLARGHVLIEDVPGVGKTMLAKSLARSLGSTFERIQFTPDLLPSDVTGVNVYNPAGAGFQFRPGPVFAQVLLADEINRATPKTQSALLEAMEERQVTVDAVTRELPAPFIVLATQNPVEFAGTFPLPEAQLDRFLMKVNLGYLTVEKEVAMLDRFQRGSPLEELTPVVSGGEVVQLQHEVQEVWVEPALKEYIVRLVQRTRSHVDLSLGASARGALGLFRAAQAKAALEGRDFVTPDDVKDLALPVLGHRLILKPNAELRGLSAGRLIEQILDAEAVPSMTRRYA